RANFISACSSFWVWPGTEVAAAKEKNTALTARMRITPRPAFIIEFTDQTPPHQNSLPRVRNTERPLCLHCPIHLRTEKRASARLMRPISKQRAPESRREFYRSQMVVAMNCRCQTDRVA